MELEAILARLTLLEDREAIRALCHRYGNLCDEGFSPVAISNMFTTDGVWDGGEMAGVHKGRAEIQAFLERLESVVSWSGHYVLNDQATITGDTASGLWRCVAPVTNRSDEDSVNRWFFQDYFFDLAKIDGQWFFKRIGIKLHKSTAYAPLFSDRPPIVDKTQL